MSSAALLELKSLAPLILRRNIAIVAPVLQKATDPIQQLFLDKIRDYKKRSSGGKLVDPSPDIERELKADLDKALKQFGGGPKVDMTKFPTIEFPEAKIDPINMEAK